MAYQSKSFKMEFQSQHNKIIKMNRTSTKCTEAIEHTVILFVDV
jgi:hypothetical protein